jgi:hypothetical protein
MDKKKEWREGGFKLLLGETPKPLDKPKKKPGRPKTSTKVITHGNTPEDGTKEGERRATYIVSKEQIEKIEDIAYWERKMIKEIIEEALGNYISIFEKKHGKIKPKPKK